MDDHVDKGEVLLAELADLAKKIFLQNSRCMLALFNREEEARLTILQRKFAKLEALAKDLGLDDVINKLYAPDFAIFHSAPAPRKVPIPALDIFLATGMTPRRVEKKPALNRAPMALENWP